MFLALYYLLRIKLSYWKQVILLCFPGSRTAIYKICNEVKALIDEEGSDLVKTTIIRNWVNQNSTHLIDNEHDSYAFDLSKVVVRVWGYRNSLYSRPHLSCGPRAYLMKEILDRLGFNSRIIDILEVNKGNPQSHTLLEYYDNELSKWIMQDPDFNVFYKSKLSDEALCAKECLQMNKENISFESSGNQVENLKNLKETIVDYFCGVVVYRYAYVGKKTIYILADGAKDYTIKNNMLFKDFCTYIDNRYIKFN